MKDWSKDGVAKKHINIDNWRWSQQFVTKDNVYLTRTSKETSKNPFTDDLKNHPEYKPVFLIFSPNKIESITKEGNILNINHEDKFLEENEGTMDLEHSKTWFPTFAYNMEAAHKLKIFRQVFD